VGVGQAERLPAYQQFAEKLRFQITSGVLRPGDRLPTEPQLSTQAGLSRSTVREALRLLASQHLIVTTRGVAGGSFVAHPSPAQLGETLTTGMRLLMTSGAIGVSELFEVHELIEAPAAALAAQRRSDEQLAALRAAFFDPDSDELDVLLAGSRAFHAALVAAAGNPLYELVTWPLHGVVNERALAEQAPEGFWRRVDTEHRAIERAVGERDSVAARAATLSHLGHLRTVFAGSVPLLRKG
jgi:GntR family transcriptional repressor for pyruvate dehydrogenase complex